MPVLRFLPASPLKVLPEQFLLGWKAQRKLHNQIASGKPEGPQGLVAQQPVSLQELKQTLLSLRKNWVICMREPTPKQFPFVSGNFHDPSFPTFILHYALLHYAVTKRKVYIFGKHSPQQNLCWEMKADVYRRTAQGISKDFVTYLLTFLLQKWPTFCLW